ncbi:MAG: NADH-quinone oxidoreductase subunit J [Nitrospiraceae bacterium]
MAQLLFFYFAGIIVLTAILVVALRNPIYSALSLLIMFFHVAGLYVSLHAEFLAAVQIIVYAGAILVLYLFVVMLLNVKREDRYHYQFPLGALLGIAILTEVVVLALQRSYSEDAVPSPPNGELSFTGNTEAIGESLFTTYLFDPQILGIGGESAMIGAIILAKKDILTR